jgi:hypothetical protein
VVGRLATKPGRPNQHSGQLQLSRTRAPNNAESKGIRYTVQHNENPADQRHHPTRDMQWKQYRKKEEKKTSQKTLGKH